jgi:periplasmic protein CpxP/Spy
MKSNRNLLLASLVAAGALLTAASSSVAAGAADDQAATPTAEPHGGHGGWHHGGPWHMLKQLNLSAAQQQQIKEIMTAARPQMKSLHEQMHANSLKLRQTQPTDANYTSISSQVSQTHGSLSAQMMTLHAELRGQVFKVLTPEQQGKLATLEAQRGVRQ